MANSSKISNAVRSARHVSDEEFKDLAIKLLEHARRAIRNKNWSEGLFARAHGETVDDLVHRAMLTLIEIDGRRGWDPEKHPDPWRHLKNVVNSFIGDQARISTRYVTPVDLGAGALPATGRFPKPTPMHELGPEDMLDEKSRAELAKVATDRLTNELLEDDELVRLHDLLEAHPELPRREIAQRMGMTPDAITNLTKRLDRKIEQVAASITRDYGDHS